MTTKDLTPGPPLDAFFSPFANATPRVVAKAMAEKPFMSENDLHRILRYVDDALAIYREKQGGLSAVEVSIKSMLTVVRTQVADQLIRENAASTFETK